MNITNPEESLVAWGVDMRAAAHDDLIPEDDRERVLHETNENHAGLYDAVTAYVQARFCAVF